jgi:hypothetical protein
VRAVGGISTSAPATYSWTIIDNAAPGGGTQGGTDPGDTAHGSSSGDGSQSGESATGGIDADAGRDGGAGTGGAGSGSGGAEPATDESVAFAISGEVDGLAPGATKPIVLTLTNPNEVAIEVTSLTVGVSADGGRPGCPSSANVLVEQARGVTGLDPLRIPAHGSVVVGSFPRAPRITLLNRPWNQDSCKGRTFTLTYAGSAHS